MCDEWETLNTIWLKLTGTIPREYFIMWSWVSAVLTVGPWFKEGRIFCDLRMKGTCIGCILFVITGRKNTHLNPFVWNGHGEAVVETETSLLDWAAHGGHTGHILKNKKEFLQCEHFQSVSFSTPVTSYSLSTLISNKPPKWHSTIQITYIQLAYHIPLWKNYYYKHFNTDMSFKVLMLIPPEWLQR